VHSDICSALEFQATHGPTASAIEAPNGDRISYLALRERIAAIGGALRQLGTTRQSRLAMVLPNGPDMAIALLGVSCAATAIPLNPAYTRSEFENYFRLLKVDGVMLQSGQASHAREAALTAGLTVTELLPGFPAGPGIGSEGAGTAPLLDPAGPEDIALVLMTSGSTGSPKRVPLTHANICSSIPEICASAQLTPADRCLCMWEQFHIGGLVDLLMAPLAAGGTVICGPRFDATTFFRILEERQPTWFQAVPATLHEILAHARKHGISPQGSSLRMIRSVAAALAPSVMAEVEALFGVPVIQTFGMTEASPLITSTALPPAKRKPGSVGRSFGTQVAIMDDAGTTLPQGQLGQVVVRGPNVMRGYEDDPAANREAFRHGWFHTGDLGQFDGDGDLFLKGRVREMINRGGEKICPQEIDDLLAAHPDVAQAAAYPIPHRVLGEDCAVAVVPRRPGALDPVEIRDFLAARLSAFKVPQRVEIVAELPRGPTGKVSRKLLTEMSATARGPCYAPPRNEMEARLAGIWASELQVPRVGIDDNFFELGGDSVSGVRLLAAVEQALGRALPVQALVRIATVRAMAEAIASGDSAPHTQTAAAGVVTGGLPEAGRRRILGALGSTGIPLAAPGRPILALHQEGGRPPLVWCFNKPGKIMPRLASQLGPDQPLYGMYSGGKLFDYDGRTHDQFAEYYVDELLATLPPGPFFLGGNCRGASVASRMANRLARQGQTPQGLFLVDFYDPLIDDFPGRMMLLFGRHSEFRAQRLFRWGRRGWQNRFRQTPEVQWLPGAHGQYFRPGHIEILTGHLRAFIDDRSPSRPAMRRWSDALVRLVHEHDLLFALYLKLSRSSARKAKENP